MWTYQLPLNEVDATKIIAASHQAFFDKGNQTIVDTAIRRTWELNHDQFYLGQAAAWQRVVVANLPAAWKALGISDHGVSVRADLYKLLLYEKGALFKPNTD